MPLARDEDFLMFFTCFQTQKNILCFKHEIIINAPYHVDESDAM